MPCFHIPKSAKATSPKNSKKTYQRDHPLPNKKTTTNHFAQPKVRAYVMRDATQESPIAALQLSPAATAVDTIAVLNKKLYSQIPAEAVFATLHPAHTKAG